MYTIYKKSTGQIERTVACGPNEIGLQFNPDESAMIEGIFPDDTHFVLDGVPTQLPSKPSPYHQFDYMAKEWVADSQIWSFIRVKRDELLTKSDYTQFPDVILSNKQAWMDYRQALRDVTTQTDPFNIVWPVAPQS